MNLGAVKGPVTHDRQMENPGRENFELTISRRSMMLGLLSGAGALAASTVPLKALRAATLQSRVPFSVPGAVRPALWRSALDALARHADDIPFHDRIAIADFAAPSATPRFHLVHLASGATTTLRVAHGRGSDPERTGWVQSFSNDPGSFASSDGAFIAADYYEGKHGQSQRLIGLDPTNSNALDRAIVIHSAWYANPDMLASYGQLGRSEGCFAVGEADLAQVFDQLGPGRLLFSAKV